MTGQITSDGILPHLLRRGQYGVPTREHARTGTTCDRCRHYRPHEGNDRKGRCRLTEEALETRKAASERRAHLFDHDATACHRFDHFAEKDPDG